MKLNMHKANRWVLRTDDLGENAFIWDTKEGEPFARTCFFYDVSTGSDNICLEILFQKVKEIGRDCCDTDHVETETVEKVRDLLNGRLFFDCFDKAIFPLPANDCCNDSSAFELMKKLKIERGAR